MVLHPLAPDPAPPNGFVPAWEAVAQSQLRRRAGYWLITQPDHAALAGALAAKFASPEFPHLEPDVVRAIGVHDAGWALFAFEAGTVSEPPLDAAGKPLSFMEIAPADFLRAWTASIDRAEEIAPIGGLIVSRHFCWLGRYRLENAADPPQIAATVRSFLEIETERQQRLRRIDRRPEAELQRLTATLQFCDLLSLYVCSGAQEAVEFPQPLASRPIRLSWRDGACALDPSPFRAPVSVGVSARQYPPAAAGETSLAFQLF